MPPFPEQAASRRSADRDQGDSGWDQNDERSRRMARFRAGEARDERRSDFGSRRTDREEQRRGSRPMGRSERPSGDGATSEPRMPPLPPAALQAEQFGPEPGTPQRPLAPNAASDSRRSPQNRPSSLEPAQQQRQPTPPRSSRPSSGRPRDNSSRFDD